MKNSNLLCDRKHKKEEENTKKYKNEKGKIVIQKPIKGEFVFSFPSNYNEIFSIFFFNQLAI